MRSQSVDDGGGPPRSEPGTGGDQPAARRTVASQVGSQYPTKSSGVLCAREPVKYYAFIVAELIAYPYAIRWLVTLPSIRWVASNMVEPSVKIPAPHFQPPQQFRIVAQASRDDVDDFALPLDMAVDGQQLGAQ